MSESSWAAAHEGFIIVTSTGVHTSHAEVATDMRLLLLLLLLLFELMEISLCIHGNVPGVHVSDRFFSRWLVLTSWLSANIQINVNR